MTFYNLADTGQTVQNIPQFVFGSASRLHFQEKVMQMLARESLTTLESLAGIEGVTQSK